ncbi:iron-siderophore ABC transporter substrate-binding protein [Granulosicoccaceae sp. 1_MG-2023]|nr:iron-siderophore ABC transporter substrate-binding protein [Granulosicoccaceae sp. 1_MG-2023]
MHTHGLLKCLRPAALILTLICGAALAEETVVDSAFGEVSVSGQAERVVTLYEAALDTALAVGANAVGAVITRGGTDVADYIKSRAGDIAIVGTPRETNIEAVIAAQPDLILAPAYTNEQQYQLLSKIAPVVVSNVPPFQPDSWERETRLYARAMGRGEAVEALIAQIGERIAEVKALVEARIPEAQRDAILIRWMPQGPLVMTKDVFSATLLRAVGFNMHDNGLVKEGRPHSEPLSLENLSGMDENWIILATLNRDGEEALAAARRSPAFSRLDAVANDRVISVSGQLWTSASGPLATLAILDDIEAAVTAIQP